MSTRGSVAISTVGRLIHASRLRSCILRLALTKGNRPLLSVVQMLCARSNSSRRMLLVTNITRFPVSWVSATGERGTTKVEKSSSHFLKYRSQPDCVFLVLCDVGLTLRLASRLWFTRGCPPLVTVDLVLRRPDSLYSRATALIKHVLLKRVDHHIHFFRDLRGMHEVYGIGVEKSSFVEFKSNLRVAADVDVMGDGEYVLCFGKSMRDFDTFFSAMERLDFPGAIAAPDFASLRGNGSRFNRRLRDLPKNVRILDEANVSSMMAPEDQIRVLKAARLVVLPILKTSIVASGISVCMSAMRLGRCVIISEGPGTSDVFSDEILTVPPEDPSALTRAIERAWTDDELRKRTAAAGLAYALRAGDEQDFYQRLIDRVCEWYRTRQHTSLFVRGDDRRERIARAL